MALVLDSGKVFGEEEERQEGQKRRQKKEVTEVIFKFSNYFRVKSELSVVQVSESRILISETLKIWKPLF